MSTCVYEVKMPARYVELSADEMECDSSGLSSALSGFVGTIGSAVTAIGVVVVGATIMVTVSAAPFLTTAVILGALCTPVGLLGIGLIVVGALFFGASLY